MEGSQIAMGFEGAERDRVGTLYWEAFRQKLRPAFASDDAGLRVVRAAMRPERMLIARVNGTVAGACGFHENGIGAADLSWAVLRSLLPAGQALQAALVLCVLARRDTHRLLVPDGLCVDPVHRGAGIGTALLDAAEQHALDRCLTAVRLSVIDRNPRAEALYRRRRFTAVGSGSLGLLGYVYGFDRYTVLEKQVTR